MTAQLFLFEDQPRDAWHPFSETRPVGELLFGSLTLRERAEAAFGVRGARHVAPPRLAGFHEEGASPIARQRELARPAPRIACLARFAPRERIEPPSNGSVIYRLEDPPAPVAVFLGPDQPPPEGLFLGQWPDGLPVRMVKGTLLESPWDLMARTPEVLERDAARAGARGLPGRGTFVLGEEPLHLGEGVSVDPGVVFDLRNGGAILGPGARVQGPARVEGPVFLGAGARLRGGSLRRSAIGPKSRVGGEVSSSVVLSCANKAHEGFLGHSVVGRWANLGAMTTTANLKHSLGAVSAAGPSGRKETGLLKAGALIGDYARLGIGTLLAPGSVVGAGSAVSLPRPPPFVPSFRWIGSGETREQRLDRFLEALAKAMARRDEALDPRTARFLSRAHAHAGAGPPLPE